MSPRRFCIAAMAGISMALLVLGGCYRTPAPGDPRLHGTRVDVLPGNASHSVRGELLAVSDDSLWILVEAPRDFTAVPLRGTEVRPFDGSVLRPHLWATAGGLLTGLGLFMACQSYDEGSGCAATIPVMLGAYHGIGLLARLAMATDRGKLLDADPDRLRPFARFPAGLPPDWAEPPPGVEERRLR